MSKSVKSYWWNGASMIRGSISLSIRYEEYLMEEGCCLHLLVVSFIEAPLQLWLKTKCWILGLVQQQGSSYHLDHAQLEVNNLLFRMSCLQYESKILILKYNLKEQLKIRSSWVLRQNLIKATTTLNTTLGVSCTEFWYLLLNRHAYNGGITCLKFSILQPVLITGNNEKKVSLERYKLEFFASSHWSGSENFAGDCFHSSLISALSNTFRGNAKNMSRHA